MKRSRSRSISVIFNLRLGIASGGQLLLSIESLSVVVCAKVCRCRAAIAHRSRTDGKVNRFGEFSVDRFELSFPFYHLMGARSRDAPFPSFPFARFCFFLCRFSPRLASCPILHLVRLGWPVRPEGFYMVYDKTVSVQRMAKSVPHSP